MRVSPKELIQRAASKFLQDGGPTEAAALAYYTVFSLPSLLLLVIDVAGVFWGQAAVSSQIQKEASRAAGAAVGEQLRGMTSGATHTATLLGIAGLVFAATSTFVQLQSALNRIWGIQPGKSGARSFFWKRILSFFLIAAIAVLVLVSLAATTALSALSAQSGVSLPRPLISVAEIAVSWLIFSLLFGLIFQVLPDADLAWKDVNTGAAVTAVLFVAGQFLIGFYLAHSSTASAYGAAGALALLLLWAYYSANIFLFGAELTEVWARLRGRAFLRSSRGPAIQQRPEPLRP
jgi:membrane protein